MNNESTLKLSGVIDMLIADSSRINEAKPQKYWYPLSMATYGTEEIVEALDSMCSFRTSMWEKTKRFEEEFSKYQGCEHSVMVNSGSSADLLMGFLLKDIDAGSSRNEVLVPAVTWPTQIWSVLMAGFNVKLVDVDPKTLNMDYEDLEKKIGPNTKAIFVVHLMGNPCNMSKIIEIADANGALVIEDCCEALGAKWNGTNVGNFGVCGSYSFFFSHHITTMEGGMIVCGNPQIAEKLRILRAHGWTRNIETNLPQLSGIDPRYTFVDWGFNVRPTDLQAGFGLRQLEKLSGFNDVRDAVAHIFFKYVKTSKWLESPIVDKLGTPSWLGLPMMIREGAPFSVKTLMDSLESEGIETRPIVTGNVARHPVASKFPETFSGDFPGADAVHERGLYIGLSPMQQAGSIEKVINCFKKFERENG